MLYFHDRSRLKDKCLTRSRLYMLNATKDICPNWFVDTPAPNVAIGKRCEPFKIEMVVQGNLTGHAWRTYNSGSRLLCGVTMPDGMKENDFSLHQLLLRQRRPQKGMTKILLQKKSSAMALLQKRNGTNSVTIRCNCLNAEKKLQKTWPYSRRYQIRIWQTR